MSARDPVVQFGAAMRDQITRYNALDEFVSRHRCQGKAEADLAKLWHETECTEVLIAATAATSLEGALVQIGAAIVAVDCITSGEIVEANKDMIERQLARLETLTRSIAHVLETHMGRTVDSVSGLQVVPPTLAKREAS